MEGVFISLICPQNHEMFPGISLRNIHEQFPAIG
jgi:hypothetical protein